VKVTLLLADAAQADVATGKIHILGAGWTATGSPLPQHAIVALVRVPAEEAEVSHQLRVTLVDPAGRAVGAPPGRGAAPHITGAFKVQKGATPAIMSDLPLVFQVPGGIALPAGHYAWRLEIDDHHDEGWSVEFTVREGTPPAAPADPPL
jgi:hypothetical protein